jgi:hypothetical protein
MEPGGTPVEVEVTIRNTGRLVEQYTIEVAGLDSDWYSAPVQSVAAMPGDKEHVRVQFHPPRQGVRAGIYPFRVIARAGGGAREQSAEGILDLRGYFVYRLDMAPRGQATHGSGKFRLKIENRGNADGRVGLEGRDQEEACRFKFPRGAQALSEVGSKIEVPMVVQPKHRPWAGPERTYDFVVSSRPLDARGESQTVAGQFTYRPWFRSFPIWPLLKWFLIVLAALVGLIVLFASGLPEQFGERTKIATAQVCGMGLYRVPVLSGVCPPVYPPDGKPNPDSCVFALGFREISAAQERLVGKCVTDEYHDGFGNGHQQTSTGFLYWAKDTNTVYFFDKKSVYRFADGKLQTIDGPGQ